MSGHLRPSRHDIGAVRHDTSALRSRRKHSARRPHGRGSANFCNHHFFKREANDSPSNTPIIARNPSKASRLPLDSFLEALWGQTQRLKMVKINYFGGDSIDSQLLIMPSHCLSMERADCVRVSVGCSLGARWRVRTLRKSSNLC